MTAVTKKNSTALADFNQELIADSGRGFENVGHEDKIIPFIYIAQKLSPQVDDTDASFIKGLKVGDAFNNATQQVYSGSKGFLFIPAAYRLQHNEWVPREKGGRFVGERDSTVMSKVTAEERGGRFGLWLENGNIIVVAGVWYGFILGEDRPSPAVIPFASTQLKKSRQLMTQLDDRRIKVEGRMIKPAFYANIIRMTTTQEENDKGKWFGWKPRLESGDIRDLPAFAELYAAAKEFEIAISKNEVRSLPVEAPKDESAF